MTKGKIKRHYITVLGSVLILSVLSGWVRADLFNGGFETGDLTGWTEEHTGGASATVVTAHNGWPPSEGSYFALLNASGDNKYVLLTQPFTPLAATDIISFDYFFDGDGTTHDVLATADILNESGGVVANLLTYTGTDWQSDTPTAPDWATSSSTVGALGLEYDGLTTYQIRFKMYNIQSGNPNVYMGIDNVAVPVPAAVFLGVLGLCVAGLKLRKFA